MINGERKSYCNKQPYDFKYYLVHVCMATSSKLGAALVFNVIVFCSPFCTIQ